MNPDHDPHVKAEALFKHLAHAYAVLSDPAQRRRFDQQMLVARATASRPGTAA